MFSNVRAFLYLLKDLKMSTIYCRKARSADFVEISIDGISTTLAELKKAMSAKGILDTKLFDIEIADANTGESMLFESLFYF